MRTQWISITVTTLLIGSCAHSPTARELALADAIKRLQGRVVVLEKEETDRRNRPPPGPAATRAAVLHAAADFLERAELARRAGDAGQASALFQSAVDEVGAELLADVEPLFRAPHRGATAEPSTAQAPAAPAEAVSPAPPAEAAFEGPPRPIKLASLTGAPSARVVRERSILVGTLELDGTYAALGGMGVVLLTPLSGGVPSRLRSRHFTLEQRDRVFVPHVVAVPVGSTVAFPNADPVFHNVFSLSDSKPFDLGVYKNGESREVVFDRAGVVHILCNLHAAMSAYVVVHDEPYAAATDKLGRFTVRGLLPGKYRLRAWHERSRQMVSREIEVEPGQTRVSVAMAADVPPSLGPNKQGVARGPQRRD